jgi:hypothetical protein
MRDVVLGVGDVGACGATAFSRLAGRELHLCPTLDLSSYLMETSVHSVFVFLPEQDFVYPLIAELMNIAAEREIGLGFLPLPDDVRHSADLAVHLARKHPSKSRDGEWCTVVNGLAYPMRSAEELRGLLARDTPVLIVVAHGNGVDLKLSDSVALCAQRSDLAVTAAQRGERFLPCHVGGVCVREAAGIRSHLGPEMVRAELIVMLTCWGLLPADGWLSGRLSFLHALLRGPSARAVVTSIRAVSEPRALREEVVTSLANGLSSGELALGMHVFHSGGYVCLGDPTVRVGPVQTADNLMTLDSVSAEVRAENTSILDQVIVGALLWIADLLLTFSDDTGSAHAYEFIRTSASLALAGGRSTTMEAPLSRERLVSLYFDTARAIRERGSGTPRLGPLVKELESERRTIACSECGATDGIRRHFCATLYPMTRIALDICPRHGDLILSPFREDISELYADADPPHLTAMASTEVSVQASALMFVACVIRATRRDETGLESARIFEARARTCLNGDAPLAIEDDLAVAEVIAVDLSARGPRLFSVLGGQFNAEETTGRKHSCGCTLRRSEVIQPPFLVRRALWFCDRCGLVAIAKAGHAPPVLTVAGKDLLLEIPPLMGRRDSPTHQAGSACDGWVVACTEPLGHEHFPPAGPFAARPGEVLRLPYPPRSGSGASQAVCAALIIRADVSVARTLI